MNALEISGLNKSFGRTEALRDVTFNVEEGSVCGLIGPNGAGKTTLLRIINNILLPDRGEVAIFSEPLSFQSSRTIGYMPEERGLYDKMTVEDQILFFGRLKGGESRQLRETMQEYMEIFNLKGEERRRIKELSKGNQQKVQIIATLVHEPRLVILDEPFSGFDPINGQLLTQLVDRLHDKGTTVILSSHNMASIEQMCSDIVLINHGQIVLSGKLADIKEEYKDGSYIVGTRTPLGESLAKSSPAIASIEPRTLPRNIRGEGYLIHKTPEASNNRLLSDLSFQSEIILFEENLPTLSDIFISATKASTTSKSQA